MKLKGQKSAMCGIVGLFIKDKALEPRLGELTSAMLSTMCERGPDSAGFAVYGASKAGTAKITVQSATPEKDFAGLAEALKKAIGATVNVGLPLLPGLSQIDLIDLLVSGVGLLFLLMFMPGGLIEGVYKIRDNLLRRVAAKHGIHVPSLVADSLVTEEEEGLILDDQNALEATIEMPVHTLEAAPQGSGG